MLKRAFDVPQMDEHELREFIKRRCEGSVDSSDLACMKRKELLDHIVDNGFPHLSHLHSECQLDGNNPMLDHCETQEEIDDYTQRCANQ